MMNKLLLLAVALPALLILSACSNVQLPGPPDVASPTPIELAATATPVPTRDVATATPVAPGAASESQAVAAPTSAPAPAEEFNVRSGKLLAAGDLRDEPDESAEVLGQKLADAIVVVTGERGDWYEVVSGLASDGHAWLPKAVVSFDLASPTTAPAALIATATAEPVTAPETTAAPVVAAPFRPQPPALDGTLVFQDAPGGAIYLMNADGGGLRRLTSGLEPALSPDGSQVAFARWDEPRGLWLINSDGSNERRVFEANRVRSPSWTADGQSVVFERSTGSIECRISPFGCLSEEALQQIFGGEDCLTTPFGTFCISDYALTTSWLTALTRYNLADGSNRDLPTDDKSTAPQAAPGGSEFIFLDKGGFSAARVEGNDAPWPVVRETVPLGPVSYSPDGQFLFATRKQHDYWQIWRWRVDGSQPAALTVPDPLGVTSANNVAPVVSPDGKSVAFLTDRTGRWELWVMNNDGSNQRPLAPDALADVPFRYDFNSDRTVDWGR